MKPTGETDFLHLLFPHVRAEIFRILFDDTKAQIHGREAARLTTLALRTVQRELIMLEAAGFLTSRKEGKFRFFSANRKHRMFAALQQLVIKGRSSKRFVSNAKRPLQPPRRSSRSLKRHYIKNSPLPSPRGVYNPFGGSTAA